jgi:hypothetical protein
MAAADVGVSRTAIAVDADIAILSRRAIMNLRRIA